ncbi:MAG: hypothetical protein QXS68_06520 [Candidatus Methanomethylicaceae archaeon]
MSRKLTKETEQRILRALDAATDEVTLGADPDLALAKAASEQKLLRSHIPLLVNAFNIGSSECHRHTFKELDDRLQPFPLAKSANVLNLMFPKNVEAKSPEEPPVASEYEENPEFVKKRKKKKLLDQQKIVKKASAAVKYASYEDKEVLRRWGDLARLDRMYEDVSREVTEVLVKSKNALDKLAESLRQVGGVNYSEFRKNCVYRYGPAALKVLHSLEKQAGWKKSVHKSSRLASQGPLVDWNSAPYAAMREVVDLANRYTKVAKQLTQVARVRQVYRERFTPEARRHPGSVLDEDGYKQANFLTGAVLGTAFGKEVLSTTLAPTKQLGESVAGKLFDPDYEVESRNADLSDTFSEIINGDPVLLAHDPEELADLYNELTRFAPRAALRPMIVRPLLRKMVQQSGVLDPYDLNFLSRIDLNLARIEHTKKPSVHPAAEDDDEGGS